MSLTPDRLRAAMLGEVELDEDEKVSLEDAMVALSSFPDTRITVAEAMAGIKVVCEAAKEAGIPQILEAELRARGIEP